jgi:cation diffusion facilitator CzcD-associated flavoprotein CzcO
MTSVPPAAVRDLVVIGTGFAGMYAVYRAAAAGIDVQGIEAGSEVGGTWYWNRYPGARCDVESVDYSYSYDDELQREWVWTEKYATQPEILNYARHVATRFGLNDRIRFNERVQSAIFDEESSVWVISTDVGEPIHARFVIFASGSLSIPIRPEFPGVDSFAGEVYFTAQWPDEGVSFEGKRVGVVGTGSSGIQVIPMIAQVADAVTVFQRTANYSIPAVNRALGDDDQRDIRADYADRRVRTRVGLAGSGIPTYDGDPLTLGEKERREVLEEHWTQGGVYFARTFMGQMTNLDVNRVVSEFVHSKIREIVKNPQTAEDLIPTDHPIGSKRICSDSGYYDTYNRENVHLVNLRREPIDQVTPTGVRTPAAFYDLDVMVYATGFDAMTGALTRIDIEGRDGLRFADAWGDGPVTYLGMSVPGFPNLFTVNGPGSPSVLSNMILGAEQQVEWIVDLVRTCLDDSTAQVEPREDSASKWTEHVDEVAHTTLYPMANSWYMGANVAGKKQVFMPYVGGVGEFKRICEDVATDHYEGLVFTSQ